MQNPFKNKRRDMFDVTLGGRNTYVDGTCHYTTQEPDPEWRLIQCRTLCASLGRVIDKMCCFCCIDTGYEALEMTEN